MRTSGTLGHREVSMVMDVCEEEGYVRTQGGVHGYGCV